MLTKKRSRDAMSSSEAGGRSSSPLQAEEDFRTPSSPKLAASGFGRSREFKTPERQVMHSEEARYRTRSPPPAPKAPTRSYRLARRQRPDFFTFARRLDFEDDRLATPRPMGSCSEQNVDDDVFGSHSRCSSLPKPTQASSKVDSTSNVAKLGPAIELTSERRSSPSPASSSSFRVGRWANTEHVKRQSTDEVQRAHGPIKRSRGSVNIESQQSNNSTSLAHNGYRERLRRRPTMSSPLCVDMQRCKTTTAGTTVSNTGSDAWKPPFGVQTCFTATACTPNMVRSASHASYLIRSPSATTYGDVRNVVVPTPPLAIARTRSRISTPHGRSASLASSLHLSRACTPSSRSSSPALHSSSASDYFGNWTVPSSIARAH